MNKRVRKAVFPVAGLGTRFLPATKAIPKEMLTVVDRPVIQYAVDEAREAGIEHFIFVTGRDKSSIENHFDKNFELEHTLRQRGKTDALEVLNRAKLSAGQMSFTRQQEPLGLGHAIWCARELVGDEPFAVLLPDMIMKSSVGCMKQMVDMHSRTGGNVIALEEVARADVHRYGVVDFHRNTVNDIVIDSMVEKPNVADAPSNLIISGRYILQPDIFNHISAVAPGAGGEIQLTDAMLRMMATQPFLGMKYNGQTFDCGHKLGFLTANIVYGLEDEDLGIELHSLLQKILYVSTSNNRHNSSHAA